MEEETVVRRAATSYKCHRDAIYAEVLQMRRNSINSTPGVNNIPKILCGGT